MKLKLKASVMVLVIALSVLVFQMKPTSATTETFYSTSSDGYIYQTGTNYNTIWTESSGIVWDNVTVVWIGQTKNNSDFGITRGFFFFDTSSLLDDVNITSATLSLYGSVDNSVTDFNLTIQNGQPTYPHDPLESGDYDKEHYSGNGGAFDTANFVTDQYNNITLNSNGVSWINKTGFTKLVVRSDREIAGTQPTGAEEVAVYAYESGNKPKLIVALTFQTKILDAGDTYIHGSFYYNGSLWFSTRTSPTRVIKMNRTDLSYEKVIVTGHNSGEDLEAAESYIWVVCSLNNTLIKINPNNLSDWSVAIDFGADLVSPQSLTYYSDYLWVGGVTCIAKVNLTDNSYVKYDYSGYVQTNPFHALASGGGYVWGTTTGGEVLKIAPSGTVVDFTDINAAISDDIVYHSGYLYFGTEGVSPYCVYKVDENDLGSYTTSMDFGTYIYGAFYGWNHTWAILYTAPGIISKLDLNLNLARNITLPSGYNYPNEMLFDEEGYAYVTCWMDPARVVKFAVEALLSIQSFPDGVTFTMNGSNYTTPVSEDIQVGNYSVVFPPSFIREATVTWTFTYWDDNTSNTNPNRTIDLQSDTSLSVTYASTYEPIPYTGYEPVFECAMNNMFELNGILEGNDTYRQMLLDSSVYENHGKLYPLTHPYAGPDLTWGRMGRALEFDGVDDSVIVSNSSSLNVTNAITVEFWFNVYNGTANQTFISKHNGTSEEWVVGINNGTLYTELWTTSGNNYSNFIGNNETTNIQEGIFYFFCLTYDYRDGYYTVYLHGVPQYNVTTDGNKIRNVDANLYLGNLANSSCWFEGVLDEVRIFPYKRNYDEIYTDARTPISRFDSWSFVNSGTSPDGEDWTVVEGTTSGYQGFNNNDPELPWAKANDTHPYTFIRSIRYMAGFQQYQLYCTLKVSTNKTTDWFTLGEVSYSWYWAFFRHGRLQVVYDLFVYPMDISPVSGYVDKWIIQMRRTTPYFATTNMTYWWFTPNHTVFTYSIPVIISAWVGPDDKTFTMRFDIQDERVVLSGNSPPFSYSFPLVDENLNPHVVDWFDGWVVAGIKVRSHRPSAGSWVKMEIASHKGFWFLAAIAIIVVVGLVINFMMLPGGYQIVEVLAKETEIKITETAEIVGTAVKQIGEGIVDALAGLAHDLILGLSGLMTAIVQSLKPITDELWKLGGAFVQGFISFMQPVLTAVAAAGMAIANTLIGLLDAIFGLFGFPGGFTQILNFIGSLWTWLTNSIGWLISSLTSFFALLPSFIGKAVNTLTTAAGIFVSMFTWFWWVLDSAHGGAQSLWNTIRLDIWIQLLIILYPVYLLWKWDEEGLDAVINHLKMILDIMAWVVNMFITVIQMFINIISSLIEKLPIIE